MNKRMLLSCMLLFFFTAAGSAQTVETLQLSHSKKKRPPVEIIAIFSLGTAAAAAKEYVFSYGMLLSELTWPVMPSLVYTVSLDTTLPKRLHVQASVSFLHSFETLPMQDKDFDNVPFSDVLTRFSEHRCRLTGGVRASAKIGIQKELPLPLMRDKAPITLMIEPMIGFIYSKLRWYSWDGYLQYAPREIDDHYAPWHPFLPKQYITGDAIAYEQEFLTPTAGIGITAYFPYRIRFYTDVHLSPSIRAWGNDVHFKRDTRFVDTMHGGWGLYCTAKLIVPMKSVLTFFAEVQYEYTGVFEGSTAIYNPANAKHPSLGLGIPGTAFHGFTCAVGIAVMFGDR